MSNRHRRITPVVIHVDAVSERFGTHIDPKNIAKSQGLTTAEVQRRLKVWVCEEMLWLKGSSVYGVSYCVR